MFEKLMCWYHCLMVKYCQAMIHWEISVLKAKGNKAGLSSLDDYSDESIVEGFRRLRDSRCESNNQSVKVDPSS